MSLPNTDYVQVIRPPCCPSRKIKLRYFKKPVWFMDFQCDRWEIAHIIIRKTIAGSGFEIHTFIAIAWIYVKRTFSAGKVVQTCFGNVYISPCAVILITKTRNSFSISVKSSLRDKTVDSNFPFERYTACAFSMNCFSFAFYHNSPHW